ncbi:MAG: heme-binding protein [Methanomethylovorans sp.]|jgi:hypothetical protein|nr:heme-binding protein [Methanomethylovorans sp.]
MSSGTIGYTVLWDLGEGVEIRQYSKQILISVEGKDLNSAFSKLANYIFGDNAEGIRISMTTPVIIVFKDNSFLMSFVLPTGFSIDNVPLPSDDGIAIQESAPRKVAVIRFSGYLDRDKYLQKLQKLIEILKDKNITPKGDAFVMQYDPPWVPPMLRFNEVAIEVE